MENIIATKIRVPKCWAIQISNSETKKWEEIGEKSYLTFRAANDLTDQGIIRTYVNPLGVKTIIDSRTRHGIGLNNFSSMKKGDFIFGVLGENVIKRIGRIKSVKRRTITSRPVEVVAVKQNKISDKEPNSGRKRIGRRIRFSSGISKKIGSPRNMRNKFKVYFEIEWDGNFNEFIVAKKIFKPQLEIQEISMGVLRQLSLPGPYGFLYLVGRSRRVGFTKRAKSKELSNEKEDNGGTVNLFYGTNRRKTNSDKPNGFYGRGRGELKFGWCKVTIPKGHIRGEIERPLGIFRIELPEKNKKHVTLKSILEQQESDFLSSLKYELNKTKEKAALIFIHGYNNSFAEAARRTAQIAWDTSFVNIGVSGFYSWPSFGNFLSYFTDNESVAASTAHFEAFIEKVVQHTEIKKIHIVAHSMGNQILLTTVNRLGSKPKFKKYLKIIHQIVLAAPDIDQDNFRDSFLPQFKNIGSQRTLYASDKDKALLLSKQLRSGFPRLGEAGNALFVDDGIDTIDASNVEDSGNNHSYIFDTKEVINDLYYLFKKGFPPFDRNLREKTLNNRKYWLFPE